MSDRRGETIHTDMWKHKHANLHANTHLCPPTISWELRERPSTSSFRVRNANASQVLSTGRPRDHLDSPVRSAASGGPARPGGERLSSEAKFRCSSPVPAASRFHCCQRPRTTTRVYFLNIVLFQKSTQTGPMSSNKAKLKYQQPHNGGGLYVSKSQFMGITCKS